MKLLPINLPPGVARLGTQYQVRNRWYDTSLVRWHEGVIQPWAGWSVLSNAGSAAVGGPVRGMYAWRAASGTVRVALGTRTKLYGYSAGTLSDITPAAMTTGAVDASGSFYARVEAHSWQLDNFGALLVACSYTDGRILSSNGTAAAAAVDASAPTSCKGVVVTPERFLVALAAGGDGRKVQWPDQESTTAWAASNTNQAGDFILPSKGQIMAGRRGKTFTFIWTDEELFAMRFIGGPLVYGFPRLGENCGVLSRRSMVVKDDIAIWMGANKKFFIFDGFVRELPCEVADFVFGRLNMEQASKVAADIRPEFNEVIWYYPSGSGTPECDSSVTYNWAENHWTLGGGGLARTDGIGRGGLLEYPLASGTGGAIYEHEKGSTYQDEGGSTFTVYAESGPLELDVGERVFTLDQFIPDEATLGAVNLRLYGRFYPTDTETTYGPFTLANPTDIRATARQFRLRLTQVSAGWRFGTGRFSVIPEGFR